jgi:hypothetical protein
MILKKIVRFMYPDNGDMSLLDAETHLTQGKASCLKHRDFESKFLSKDTK